MNLFEIEKKILKAKSPDEIDAITKDLDNQTLRDLIKLLIDRLTPTNVKINRIINSEPIISKEGFTEVSKTIESQRKPKVRFCDIKEKEIAIRFHSQKQLENLVDHLMNLGYDYGTGGKSVSEIKYLRLDYFGGVSGQALSLDRSCTYHPRPFASCGIGYKDTMYDYKDIDWSI